MGSKSLRRTHVNLKYRYPPPPGGLSASIFWTEKLSILGPKMATIMSYRWMEVVGGQAEVGNRSVDGAEGKCVCVRVLCLCLCLCVGGVMWGEKALS